MARILIVNWNKKIIETIDPAKPLLRQFHDNGLDWMHACGGKGRCTTCKVIVIEGHANFSSVTPAELRYRAMGALRENERLSCQCRVNGDITILVPEKYKLPHIDYNA